MDHWIRLAVTRGDGAIAFPRVTTLGWRALPVDGDARARLSPGEPSKYTVVVVRFGDDVSPRSLAGWIREASESDDDVALHVATERRADPETERTVYYTETVALDGLDGAAIAEVVRAVVDDPPAYPGGDPPGPEA